MYKIKTVENENELSKVFDFISSTFYEDAKKYNEHYFPMEERYKEMQETLKTNNCFLMYIEDNNEIIASITGKNINKEKITLGTIAVSLNYRRKGLAKQLITEFEKRCLENNIKHIDLGSRYRACSLYLSMNYKPSLMIQVYNSNTIKDIENNNKYNLKEISSYQGNNYGYIIYEIDKVTDEYIKYFEETIPTSNAQYIFEKDL